MVLFPSGEGRGEGPDCSAESTLEEASVSRMVTVRASPVVRWQADAESCSTYGRVAMMGDEPFRALLEAIDDEAFPHSYFDDVIDTHSDDSDDEVRLIAAPPAPPLLLFVDKQMGGRA
jgi:hypothetical protein